MDRNFVTLRIQPGHRNVTQTNPPNPTSDQINSLTPTIAGTGRIKYKILKKKKKDFRNKEKIMAKMKWYKSRSHAHSVPTPIQTRYMSEYHKNY